MRTAADFARPTTATPGTAYRATVDSIQNRSGVSAGEPVCSNSRWTTDGLQVELRQPFDMIDAAAAAHEKEKAAGVTSNDLSVNWLLGQDSNLQPSG
jgi:hypothetical protein